MIKPIDIYYEYRDAISEWEESRLFKLNENDRADSPEDEWCKAKPVRQLEQNRDKLIDSAEKLIEYIVPKKNKEDQYFYETVVCLTLKLQKTIKQLKEKE